MNTIFSITENYLDYCKTQKMLDKKTLKAYSTDLSQFVSTPETKKAPVAVESEQSTRVKPSEPGSEPEKKE